MQVQPQVQLASVTTAAGAVNTQTSGVGVPRLQGAGGMELVLDVTAAATDVGDTLDVKVQTKIGGNWVDVVYFTQVLGNGGAKRFAAKLMAQTAFALGDIAGALTAGNIRHLFGDEWRVAYVQVDANSNASFAFTVTAVPF